MFDIYAAQSERLRREFPLSTATDVLVQITLYYSDAQYTSIENAAYRYKKTYIDYMEHFYHRQNMQKYSHQLRFDRVIVKFKLLRIHGPQWTVCS